MGWFTAVFFVAVLAASLVGTRLVLWLLRSRSILDLPNERSSHGVATPRGGGLAVITVLIIAWFTIGSAGSADQARTSLVLCSAALGLGIVSWIDDLKGLTVVWRLVVQAGVVIMIVLGTVAKFGALFTTIPQPIVGGMYCAMFGMIASVGLSNLQFVDLNSARNLFIVGFAFFMGLSVPEYFNASPVAIDWWFDMEKLTGAKAFLATFATAIPDVINTIGKTGMAVGGFLAFFLDNTIPGTDEERGLIAGMADAETEAETPVA